MTALMNVKSGMIMERQLPMSKEEVIEALKEMIEYGDPYEVNIEACREAIRLLGGSC